MGLILYIGWFACAAWLARSALRRFMARRAPQGAAAARDALLRLDGILTLAVKVGATVVGAVALLVVLMLVGGLLNR